MSKLLVLSAGRMGDLEQLNRVAKALGWPSTVLTLRFADTSNAAIALRPLHYLTDGTIADIHAQGADVVLCAEASACAVAVRAKRNGQFKLVCIGRPRGHFDDFDLIITSPQYPVPAAPNVVELPVAPHSLGPLSDADKQLADRFKIAGKPMLAVMVGGTSVPDVVDANAARVLALDLNARCATANVHVVTSPRTGQTAVQALRDSLLPVVELHVWDRTQVGAGRGSPYRALLHAADGFIVTSDSVSMVAEAMLTGKPVQLHRLPRAVRLSHSVVRALSNFRPAHVLFNSGILEVRPQRDTLFSYWHEHFGLGLDQPGSAKADFPETANVAAKLIAGLANVHSR